VHALIVSEFIRLLQSWDPWPGVMDQNKHLARSFKLDALIACPDPTMKKIGLTMGALLMVKVTNLELSEVVDSDYSMEKINQSILKYVIS
jgi:hypothetical protein